MFQVKIKELEDICQHFDLSVEGPKKQESGLRFRHFCPSSKLLLFQEIARYDWTRPVFLSYNARGFSNKNAIECIVGVVEGRANFKEHKRMYREVRGAAECF